MATPPSAGPWATAAATALCERSEERLHGRPLAAALDQQKIVTLRGERQEAEAVETGDRRNGHAPVGTALGHRGGDRVVRAQRGPPARPAARGGARPAKNRNTPG